MTFRIEEAQRRSIEYAQFEEFMLGHLRTFSRLHANVLEEEGLRLMIHLGRQRAEGYQFTQSGPWQLYVELMFILGSEFDTDPQYPWAAQILNDRMNPDQFVRANDLHRHVMAYLSGVTGADRIHAKTSLVKAREIPFAWQNTEGRSFDDEMLVRLEEIFPERFRYVGEDSLRSLIQSGKKEAERYGVTSKPGLALIIALKYVLGHGVCRDLKYAFVDRTLTNNAIPDANARAERLYAKTMTYLDHALNSAR